MVEVNWLAVLLATLASMVVGSLWYAPPLLGKIWMRLADIDEKKMEKAGLKPIVISIATSAVLAFVLAYFTYLAYEFYKADYSFLVTALMTAAWAWLGFVGLRLLTHDSYEGRPFTLTLLNSAHELVTMLAMALAIGLVGV